jgi:hypothetical protein
MRLRFRFDWKLWAGSLATLVTLALSAPGVRVVHAEEVLRKTAAQPIAEGPSCQLGAQQGGTVQVILDRDRSGDTDSPTVALNNRGYSYRLPAVDPEPIDR